MTIADRIVLITGASGGIGLAAAKLLSSKGAKVALASRSVEKLSTLEKELPGSFAVRTDMTVPEDIRHMVEATLNHFGRIDILINNAGQGLYAPLEQVDIDEYRSIVDLNIFGPFLAMQAVIPIMRSQGGGMIVNISSMVSKMAISGLSAYASTKYALNALSLTARAELQKDHIIVGSVMPSLTDTNFGTNSLGGGLPSRPADNRPANERMVADSPEKVAEKILEAIETERAETLLVTPR
jgi:short-subunit dehydrogenase